MSRPAAVPSSPLAALWERAGPARPWLLWALFAAPALAMIPEMLSDDPRALHRLLHPTGEFAARFLVVALLATPLRRLLPGWRGPRLLMRNRRYLGVAAFGYAALHLALYLADRGELAKVIEELPRLHFWVGWVAFALMAAPAVTSWDGARRRLGTAGWNRVQKLTYAVAFAVFVHWAATERWEGLAPALIHFGPLAALQAWRVWDEARRRAARA